MSHKFVRRLTAVLFATTLTVPLAAQSEVHLRPGDAIRIEFRDEPDLTGEFNIDSYGFVLVPLLGLVQATDRPFEQFREGVLDAYALELVEPVLRITPLLRVAVLGEVREPGLFPLDPTHKVSDVLAAAGGLTPEGRIDRIQLVRDGSVLNARLDPQSSALGARIRSGDQIIVAQRSWLSRNTPFVIGALSSVVAAAIASAIVR